MNLNGKKETLGWKERDRGKKRERDTMPIEQPEDIHIFAHIRIAGHIIFLMRAHFAIFFTRIHSLHFLYTNKKFSAPMFLAIVLSLLLFDFSCLY